MPWRNRIPRTRGYAIVKLCLVQHGEAVSEDVDPDRPLSAAGLGDVARLAALLRGRFRPARIVHSGKTRARQTAELLAAALTPGKPVDTLPGLGPNDPVTPVAGRLEELGDDVVIVGHLPFMGRLAAVLVTGQEHRPVVSFRPGTMLCLGEQPDGNWAIDWMLSPDVTGG